MASYYQQLASGALGPRCAACAAYNEPGRWSALCRKGHADWMHAKAPPIVRAGNWCDRFEARDAVAVQIKEAA